MESGVICPSCKSSNVIGLYEPETYTLDEAAGILDDWWNDNHIPEPIRQIYMCLDCRADFT